MNEKDLIDFENEVIERFKNKEIRSPVHLSGSKNQIQEKKLIEIFKYIKKEDWVFSTYRSHYHALLKGIPRDWLMKWILENKSIHVMNKEHNFVTSAIVGGTLSQAVGVAMTIKKNNGNEHVWCFIGDMTASLGVFHDCLNYSRYNNLPIKFVIENNELSTDTPTKEAWGFEDIGEEIKDYSIHDDHVIYYKYERIHPHYGIVDKEGKRIKIDFDT